MLVDIRTKGFEPMNIRRARTEDAPCLAALSIEVWLGTYIRKGITPMFADYVLAEFTAHRFLTILDDADEQIFVSDNMEGIDGYVRVSHGRASGAEACCDTEIATLYVQPRHQGRKIGKRLLAEALGHCVSLGATRPWLMVNSENSQAIGFYQSQGFALVGQTHFRIEDNAYLNEILAIDLGR
jgi:ribosomal protein S18 acetylase RimI-like enzyme